MIEQRNKHGIYQIVNLINNNCYIGSATNLINRERVHWSTLKNNKHDNPHLQNAYNLYGKEVFEFKILEYIEDIHQLNEREQYYFDLLLPEYNILKIAGSPIGHVVTEETRYKIGHNRTYARGINHPGYGKPIPEYVRQMLKEINTGKKLPQEQKDKISEFMRGSNNPNALLSESDVTEIKIMLQNGFGLTEIGKKYRVTKHTIFNIKVGRTWKHVNINHEEHKLIQHKNEE